MRASGHFPAQSDPLGGRLHSWPKQWIVIRKTDRTKQMQNQDILPADPLPWSMSMQRRLKITPYTSEFSKSACPCNLYHSDNVCNLGLNVIYQFRVNGLSWIDVAYTDDEDICGLRSFIHGGFCLDTKFNCWAEVMMAGWLMISGVQQTSLSTPLRRRRGTEVPDVPSL